MNKLVRTRVALILAALFVTGCSGAFWGGAGTGAVGTGAGYEYKANEEIKRIEELRREGKITEEEYRIRLDQIKRGSAIQ